MNISIAIADTNSDYVERLAEVLAQYNDLTISIYTNVERLEEHIVRKHFDIVLFDADFCERPIAFLDTKLPICLYHEKSMRLEYYPEVVRIKKFQRISGIYKDMVKLFADKAGMSFGIDQSQKTKFLAVYSPTGGSGKTTIAMAMALKLMEYGNSVLFLSAEQISSSSLLNQRMEEGITELLSCMNDKSVNFELKVKGLAKQGFQGMHYIEGFERIVDYLDTKPDEMAQLLEMIKKIGAYGVIVIDMGSTMDGISKVICEIADSIAIVDKPGEMGSLKMDLFVEQSVYTDFEKKMYRVKNFAEANAVYSRNITIPCIGEVHNYGNMQITSLIQNVNMNNEIAVGSLFQ